MTINSFMTEKRGTTDIASVTLKIAVVDETRSIFYEYALRERLRR